MEWNDKLPGGLADKKNPKDFDSEKLKEGIKIELEHTDDPEIAKEISMDHLTEDPDYYKKLKTIESAVIVEDKVVARKVEEFLMLQKELNKQIEKMELITKKQEGLKNYIEEKLGKELYDRAGEAQELLVKIKTKTIKLKMQDYGKTAYKPIIEKLYDKVNKDMKALITKMIKANTSEIEKLTIKELKSSVELTAGALAFLNKIWEKVKSVFTTLYEDFIDLIHDASELNKVLDEVEDSQVVSSLRLGQTVIIGKRN